MCKTIRYYRIFRRLTPHAADPFTRMETWSLKARNLEPEGWNVEFLERELSLAHVKRQKRRIPRGLDVENVENPCVLRCLWFEDLVFYVVFEHRKSPLSSDSSILPIPSVSQRVRSVFPACSQRVRSVTCPPQTRYALASPLGLPPTLMVSSWKPGA